MHESKRFGVRPPARKSLWLGESDEFGVKKQNPKVKRDIRIHGESSGGFFWGGG